ncbi:DUF1192 domain-containing protein [Hwanghaeella grinnelliae]|jgi:uncharacterized small protein (DUF1192 family)|uniref:DUF1192 domain-containing protein n=1 Tax=Hwanghaeella grinnelliae TaxID=2500179 RepID=A0A3S2Z5S1_9PROT|nr:DUF1192 domain-containing protein [Hwanghaeella grinnelliae]RVU33730.1 DUF1192 domain-containing protein [Hwanghaeella grinnelliae]
MNPDDLEPPKPKTLEQADLDMMSIEALEEYIAEREAEIERAKAKIAGKQSARGVAETFFKS